VDFLLGLVVIEIAQTGEKEERQNKEMHEVPRTQLNDVSWQAYCMERGSHHCARTPCPRNEVWYRPTCQKELRRGTGSWESSRILLQMQSSRYDFDTRDTKNRFKWPPFIRDI
jgi:hypothetical protein